MGSLSIVGIGPGDPRHMTPAASRAITDADMVVGYDGYLALVAPLLAGKEAFGTSMRRERERADHAIREAANGRRVCVVAGGDACVYGIGGLVLERMTPSQRLSIPVEIVPGITAANAAAALLGAPLMNDYAVISLSDILCPRGRIIERLHAAGAGDMVAVLYNPRSRSRTDLLLEAGRILEGYRGPDVPVGIVTHACRPGCAVRLCSLGGLPGFADRVDMSSVVIVGASDTRRIDDMMVTPRGYAGEGEEP